MRNFLHENLAISVEPKAHRSLFNIIIYYYSVCAQYVICLVLHTLVEGEGCGGLRGSQEGHLHHCHTTYHLYRSEKLTDMVRNTIRYTYSVHAAGPTCTTRLGHVNINIGQSVLIIKQLP